MLGKPFYKHAKRKNSIVRQISKLENPFCRPVEAVSKLGKWLHKLVKTLSTLENRRSKFAKGKSKFAAARSMGAEQFLNLT